MLIATWQILSIPTEVLDMNAPAPATQFATASQFNAGLADAWRISSQDVANCIRFVRQYLKVIAERDEVLLPKMRLHSVAYVEQCEKLLPWQMSLYLHHVRNISECEAKMDALGMAYAISSDDWRA